MNNVNNYDTSSIGTLKICCKMCLELLKVFLFLVNTHAIEKPLVFQGASVLPDPKMWVRFAVKSQNRNNCQHISKVTKMVSGKCHPRQMSCNDNRRRRFQFFI